MPRGGKRQGSAGTAYSNRTDLTSNYDNTQSAAAPAPVATPPPQARPSAYPEDSPMLADPTQRPDEPITAGLDYGPGPDSSALDPRVKETQALKKWLPLLDPLMDQEDTPQSVRALVKYVRGM